MASFAFITEGITDQAAIESILIGVYDDEPEFRQAQPPRDKTDKYRQGDFAGWEKVFEYCGLDKFESIFSTNDFAIIQLDTDIAEHEKLKIALTSDGNERPATEIIEDFKKSLIQAMQPGVYEKYKDRIIFAIVVHSLECWILLLHGQTKADFNRTKACADHLDRALQKKGEDSTKEYRNYQRISKDFMKKKNVTSACAQNMSLSLFVSSLPADKKDN